MEVAGSCPDIRRASEKKKPVNRVGWVVVELEGAGVGFGDGVVRHVQSKLFIVTLHHSSVNALFEIKGKFTRQLERTAEKKRQTAGDLDNLEMLALRMFVLLGLSWTSQASGDPWGKCPVSRKCNEKFGDGSCDRDCMEPVCLRDGFDCLKDRTGGPCKPSHIVYCRDHYANSHCDQGCDNGPCGWDGSDCFTHQSPLWAKGTLILHANIPQQRGTFSNSSLLWALSVLLQSPLKLRGSAPLAPDSNLFDFDAQQLANMLAQASPTDSNGSLLFLQVDNRPCSRLPSTCFPYATEAANFLRAVLRRPKSSETRPELNAVISIKGVREEIGSREEDTVIKEVKEPTPAWLWAVIAIALGLLLVLSLVAFLVVRRVRQHRAEREDGHRVRHRSIITDSDPKSKAATTAHTAHQDQRVRLSREKEKISLRKKKKAKEAEKKRRREPLGEDAIRMRPLKRDQDIGSDTDFTQSSMEDINARCSRRHEDASICDHRSPEQKHYRGGNSQPRRSAQSPPRGWERNAMPPPLLSPPQQSAEWCGPDGSVVLIRAVRSGLDRVVLELLRAGVPVNNTDHTGRSALHWACSVNHLSLTRTLIRYGAAVDLQDNKGETPLFLSALHGCYDTARLLLLHGANLELHDRRGRRPIDVAREGMRHQILELLLAHQIQRGPVTVEAANEMLWEERALMYSPWGGPQGLPGRSASFSGIIAHRDMTPPPQNDWSMSRVQYPSPQNWRPQLNQSATALVPPRVMGRSPRPISTLQEVTSEDEDRDRHQEAPRAATPHFLSPQPAPRQRSFSCTQHALQRRSSAPQPEPNYLIVTDNLAHEPIERVVVSPPTDAAAQSDRPPFVNGDNPSRAEQAAVNSSNSEQKSRGERSNNNADSTQTAL
ncbi:neurogenic locus notch homolog protein 1 [Cheilinus undulatus]|uniref:neurogenic locus notch homolog protein 1 n=1 Tax=Cheilinus undulatus TaxID=241271 RepID=UPI001BD660A4|nr:neurogenic locus notch homolog protein 1 [Cheilinus undulatus]